MNSLLFFLSKYSYPLFLLLVGVILLVAPMSTKEEKPLYIFLIGFAFILLSGISFVRKNKQLKSK